MLGVGGWAATIGGLCVIWAGILLRGWAIVRSGPCAAIRHPAYTGNLLMYAGRLGEPYREYTLGTARLIPRVW